MNLPYIYVTYAPPLGLSCPQERGRVRLRDMSRQSYVPLIPSFWGRWESNLRPTALYSPQVVGLDLPTTKR